MTKHLRTTIGFHLSLTLIYRSVEKKKDQLVHKFPTNGTSIKIARCAYRRCFSSRKMNSLIFHSKDWYVLCERKEKKNNIATVILIIYKKKYLYYVFETQMNCSFCCLLPFLESVWFPPSSLFYNCEGFLIFLPLLLLTLPLLSPSLSNLFCRGRRMDCDHYIKI